MQPSRKAQIASFITDAVSIEVLEKYAEYANVFSKKVIVKLPEYIEINDHSINLEEGNQPYYEPIYSLGLVELKTLKTYIKDNLKNGYIKPLKSHTRIPILFVKKADGSLRLCIDY